MHNNNNIPFTPNDLPDAFADFFGNKIENIVNTTHIDPAVYNGTPKVQENNFNFMTEVNIIESIMKLKLKNTEGHDRIPQRLLIDGVDLLIKPQE